MINVVLDTNVWLSAIFWKGEAYKLLELAEKKKINIIVTKEILLEITEVLNKEAKFQNFLEKRGMAIDLLIRTVLSITELIKTKSKVSIIKHSSDNIFLEAAIDGKVNYIVSYDKHLLKLKSFNSIDIILPSKLLKILLRNN